MVFNEIILNGIKEQLTARHLTLAIAESVTSGFLQAAFSSAREASNFFQGGITVYNLGQKTRHLNIDPIHAQHCNCVSDKVSEQMAIEVCRMFLSNYGIGITGYATKVPEMGVLELYAHFAISFNSQIIFADRISSVKDTSSEVQLDFTNQVIEKFYRLLFDS